MRTLSYTTAVRIGLLMLTLALAGLASNVLGHGAPQSLHAHAVEASR